MLYDKLKNYSKSGIYPFHMPGHKRTDITEEGIIPYNIDITEIHDFDNLHSPNGVIDEIQKKAAKLYNAKNAFILINGSTGGILSAISMPITFFPIQTADTIFLHRFHLAI